MPSVYRFLFALVFGLSLFVSGYYRAKARAAGGTIPRRAEGGRIAALRLAGGLPLAVVILLYIFAPAWLAWAAAGLPAWARLAGAGLGLGCLLLMRWVFTSIGQNVSETILTKPGHTLVTHGPYRWVRHPLYLTGLLLIFALGLIADSWLLLAAWVLAAPIFRFVVIPQEEANLIAAFGDSYREYRKRTGALLPRLP